MTKRNNQGRIDLSDWVIHFVHDRKSEDNPQDLKIIAEMEGYEGDLRLPDYYDTEGKGHNLFSEYDEDIFLNNKDAKAFDILLKILHDGFIHSGWSLRNMRPTIYGPKTAVCFTEMPLYALVQYAKIRGDNTGYVGSYGIAFRRNELFAAGGRPVMASMLKQKKHLKEYSKDVYLMLIRLEFQYMNNIVMCEQIFKEGGIFDVMILIGLTNENGVGLCRMIHWGCLDCHFSYPRNMQIIFLI